MNTNTHTTSEYVIEWIGQLHNRASLITQLELDAGNISDGQLLQAAWQRWGEALAGHLTGDFALVIHDNRQSVTYLTRDPLGVKPLYYRIDQGRLACGFSIPQLRQRSSETMTQDMDWAAAYLLHLSFSQTETAYKEISKLAPGHWLSVDSDGRIKTQRYHQWQDDAPITTRRDPQWVEAYRELLEEAIRCRMDPHAPMGAENSGGIDSGTITAYLAHFLGDPGDRLYSFGFALCEQEPSHILETSQALRIRHNYVITDHYGALDESAQIARELNALGYPQEHGNAGAHIPFYEECQHKGIGTLFSGFGGDEVVTNQGGHLRWELLDHGDYHTLWGVLPGNVLTKTLRLLKTTVIDRTKPAYNPSFLRAWHERWPHQLLRPEVVARLNLYERYMETARYDAPFRRTNDFILEHHLKRMQVTARLENCTIVADAHGVDYRWPLWDTRLVQQYLSTPSIEKLGPNGVGRYLHRRAIDGLVPKRVAWKPSKDMGYAQVHRKRNETGVLLLAEQAKSLESDMHPALDGLIDRDKFRQQIARAAQGKVDNAFGFSFRRSLLAMQRLNAWLQGA